MSAEAAARYLRAALGDRRPSIALVLGSGLGHVAELVDDAVAVPFAEVPGWPAPTVAGHGGHVVAGSLEGVPVLALAGRFHLYEGHAPEVAALPVRAAYALGVRTLFVSNAAGGIRRTFRPGDLMLIRDHINLMWKNPLVGPVAPDESRFPDMSAPYDPALLRRLRECALELGVATVEGVYVGLLGPTYETPAEVRMLELLGGDAVGMSTVPEVIVARALGMRVAGVSCITNVAAGYGNAPLSHQEVLDVTERVRERFGALVRRWVRSVGAADA